MALEADALHLKTDVYTASGVGIGILLIKLTGLAILDSIVAILVALMISRKHGNYPKMLSTPCSMPSYRMRKKQRSKEILKAHSNQFIDYHKLKTRKSGNMKHIDFHITVPSNLTVEETHNIIGILKKAMNESLKNTRVDVHVDPYRKKKKTKEVQNLIVYEFAFLHLITLRKGAVRKIGENRLLSTAPSSISNRQVICIRRKF